jgi:hypothetical protein
MVTGSSHVAATANGQPKKKLVLNAFVEMCTLYYNQRFAGMQC